MIRKYIRDNRIFCLTSISVYVGYEYGNLYSNLLEAYAQK